MTLNDCSKLHLLDTSKYYEKMLHISNKKLITKIQHYFLSVFSVAFKLKDCSWLGL